MQIDNLVSQIMKKFEYANGYSEITPDRLEFIIRKYLVTEHENQIEELAYEIDLKKRSGEAIDMNEYKQKYADIKANIIEKAEEIAQTNKF